MGVKALALLWGFAEATLFFVVPEVLITWVALDRLRLALDACLLALAGALVGGVLMYSWGAARNDQAVAAVDLVPAVSHDMLAAVARTLEERGPSAMIPGAFIGRPYKAYAVQAPGAGIGLAAFMLATVPARLLRFVLAALMTNGLARLAAPWPEGRRRALLIGFWLTLYALFWTLMPN
jgi:hypothetical protein